MTLIPHVFCACRRNMMRQHMITCDDDKQAASVLIGRDGSQIPT